MKKTQRTKECMETQNTWKIKIKKTKETITHGKQQMENETQQKH